jgi:hypothetical protein
MTSAASRRAEPALTLASASRNSSEPEYGGMLGGLIR